jgi:hypothetical protein
MKKLQPRVVGVNALGAIGYMLMWLVWVLLIAVIVTLLMERSVVVPTQPVETTEPQPIFAELTTGVAYLAAAVVVAFTIAVLVLLPYLVGKWSSIGLRGVLNLLRIVPTRRAMFLTKSIVTVFPLIGFFIVMLLLSAPTMLFALLYMLAVVAAIIALGLFFLQLIIARTLHVSERSVW